MYKILNHTRGIQLIEFYNNNNFHVILSNYGASIYEIDTVDKKGESEIVTLSPQSAYYFNNDKYCGLTVGRVIGRIKNASFTINGKEYKMEPNENGNLLHSGKPTLAYRIFDYTIDDYDDRTVITYLKNVKDMEDGFPGDLELKISYTLNKKEDIISVDYKAFSNKDTLLNISNHSYFNLSGNLKRDITEQYLTINKNYIAKMNDELILEYVEPVTKEYDFRKEKLIGEHIYSDSVRFAQTRGYDNCYIDTKPLVLNLYDKESGRNLEITSDYQDVVIYTNNYVGDSSFIPETIDRQYLGIAIEPSRLSKTVGDKLPIQKAHALYKHNITYKFTIREE